MTNAKKLRSKVRLPVMAGPMFIASTADLVIAQCNAGIIGSMPALNPRTTDQLDADITRIRAAVGDKPYAINLVAHASNSRLDADLEVVLRHKVPIVVLALAANPDLVRTLQANGSLVFQDVIKNRHAQKCAEMGVDGIIAVGAGRGRTYRGSVPLCPSAGNPRMVGRIVVAFGMHRQWPICSGRGGVGRGLRLYWFPLPCLNRGQYAGRV